MIKKKLYQFYSYFKKEAVAGIILLIFLPFFIYYSSPKLQKENFKFTHPEYVTTQAYNLRNWRVEQETKNKKNKFYISADYNYSVNNKEYHGKIKPVELSSFLINKFKIAEAEINRLKKNHNTQVLVSEYHLESAILFVDDRWADGWVLLEIVYKIFLIGILLTVVYAISRVINYFKKFF